MKNKKIFVFSILFLIITGIMSLTVSFRTKMDNQMFDNLMILYGVIYLIGIITFVIVVAKSMSKKLIITIVTSILCIFVLFVGFIKIITLQNQIKTVQNQTKSRLVSTYYSMSLGGGNLDYSINLTNLSDEKIFIQSVQPLVNEKLKNNILSKNMFVVNKEIQPNKAIAITGKIIFDTKGIIITKEMTKFEPFITDIKVVSTENISLNRIIKK
ncbi:hypothetical protein [Clostridium estertheticum]|uniref:hypothetical protein n=1 Tax=Clostridium estertheticum TaxID=238834 RepID=UPI0018778ECD|nr:hypothetical protein [Clostridium estertheticum]